MERTPLLIVVQGTATMANRRRIEPHGDSRGSGPLLFVVQSIATMANRHRIEPHGDSRGSGPLLCPAVPTWTHTPVASRSIPEVAPHSSERPK